MASDWITILEWLWGFWGILPVPVLGCGALPATAAVLTSEVWCDGIRPCNIAASELLIAGHLEVTKCHHISQLWLSAQTLSHTLSFRLPTSPSVAVWAPLSYSTWSGANWTRRWVSYFGSSKHCYCTMNLLSISWGCERLYLYCCAERLVATDLSCWFSHLKVFEWFGAGNTFSSIQKRTQITNLFVFCFVRLWWQE